MYLWALVSIHDGCDVQILAIAGTLNTVSLHGWQVDDIDEDGQPTSYSRDLEGRVFLLQRLEFGKPSLMMFRCFGGEG